MTAEGMTGEWGIWSIDMLQLMQESSVNAEISWSLVTVARWKGPLVNTGRAAILRQELFVSEVLAACWLAVS